MLQYDEVFPRDKETKHGGFYINSGQLKFREMDFSDEEDTKVCLLDATQWCVG